MRYTASKRMVSAAISSDEKVYEIDVTAALFLVFMIVRADNLGRLPGEPDVLRHHIFFPRKPRAEYSEEEVERILSLLSVRGIARWYERDGVRYVALTNFHDHQTLHKRLMLSDLPAPSEVPGESRDLVATKSRLGPDGVATTSAQTWVEEEEEEEEEKRKGARRASHEGVRELIRGVGGAKKIKGELKTGEPQMQERLDRTWKWVEENTGKEEQRSVMSFAAWLFKTGTHDAETILALVKHRVVHRPMNEHAYYANTGAARDGIATRVVADRAIAEHERIKKEEREFLDGRK